MLKHLLLLGVLVGTGAQDAPLRVHIRAGKKTHGPGQHDHPKFLEDWTALLKQRGAVVTGSMEFPTSDVLGRADVLVMYCAEGGTVAEADRSSLDAFTKRGGGIVVIHDAVCGNDPQWFKTVVGGAWEHKKSKFLEGPVGLYVQDYEHPITQGVANFFVEDEIYWDLHLMPEAKVIGTAFRTPHEITPQLWVYEKDAYRAFVSIPGHNHATFSLPHYRAILLRGIAWAGKRAVDSLVSPEELASLRYPKGGPVHPKQASSTLSVPADFDLSLVLGEPDVVKPISFNWDEKGRLWVLQTPMYPNKAATWQKRPYDLLAYYEERNGRLERRVFYDQLDLPTSFVFHRDGVVVMQSPEILFLRDTDGDGTADKREVLFRGFGFGDTHATASNLRWGLDGWIYATQGYSGGASNVLNKEGKACGKIGNGLFRFLPDGSEIEVVASYGGNTWGLDVAWDGELFFSMANGSHLRHLVMPESALSRGRVGKLESWRDITNHRDSHPPIKFQHSPYFQIDNVGGFTATAGGTLYDGGAWPDAWRHVHFNTECTINLVHQDRVSPAGVSYQAEKVPGDEFMTGTDLWFRPVDTQVGPDGALYVADFYNQAVVHNDTRGPKHGPFNAAVRPDRDHLHGRLWRVQHKQAKPLSALDATSADGLVKALEHPNRQTRFTALRLLVERSLGAAELAALLKSTSRPETKVLCLWALQRQGALPEAALVAALGDADAGVRKNAARVAAALGKGETVGAALRASLDDPDPRARLEKLIALAAFPGGSAEGLLALAPKLDDPYSKSALLGALSAMPVEAFAAAAAAGDRTMAEELAASAGNRQDGALAARLVVAAAGLPDARNEIKVAALVRLHKALGPAVEAPVTPELSQALGALLRSGDPGLVGGALPFAARWVKDDSLSASLAPVTEALLKAVADPSRPESARVESLSALLSLPSARARAIEAAGTLLSPSTSADLQKGAIEALGNVADASVASALLDAWPRLSGGSREAAFAQLLRRPEWSAAVVDRLQAKTLTPNELGPSALFRLRTHPDGATAKKAAKVLETLGAGNAAKAPVIEKLWPEVEKAGDLVRGRALMTEHCLKCHQYKGEGRAIAPDLTGMGVHGKHELLVHVIDPNRTVEGNYVSFNVRTKDGEVFNGLVARETRDTVVLKNNEGDREIRRSAIDVMRSTGLSLMPEGLEALGPEALRDILSFLAAEAGNFRFLDLGPAFTASTLKGIYDPQREPQNLKLAKFGVVRVGTVPFNLVDPGKSLNGNNAVVLKGGNVADWWSKTSAPRKVEIPVGFEASRIHVLGGIAAWGATRDRKGRPTVKVTFHFADGTSSVRILHDGVEFADWIRRIDVSGSAYAEGVLQPGATGQVRWFTMAVPKKAPLQLISLESYDHDVAPTFLAMTAEVGESKEGTHAPAPALAPVLVVGGGSSHDFNRWWKDGDAALLGAAYTDDVASLAARLPSLQVLYLANNQPMKDPALRKAVFDFADGGKGLLLAHAATWYNWADWPDYNRQLVGGGTKGHEKLQEFIVRIEDEAHPLAAGVRKSFRVKDELYRFKKDPEGPEIHVVAVGTSLETGQVYPVLWTVKRPGGRVACLTLGHDGDAHEHEAYKAILKNAAAWLSKEKQ